MSDQKFNLFIFQFLGFCSCCEDMNLCCKVSFEILQNIKKLKKFFFQFFTLYYQKIRHIGVFHGKN